MELNVTTTLEGKDEMLGRYRGFWNLRQTQNMRIFLLDPYDKISYNPNIKYMTNKFKNPNVIAEALLL